MSESGRFRGVLWDLDDTLVPYSTFERWQWAWRPQGPLLPERHVRAALRKGLKSWDRQLWRELVGLEPAANAGAERAWLRGVLFDIAGHSLPDAETDAVLNRLPKFPEIPEPFPDVLGCLKALKSHALSMAVLASEPGDRTAFILRHNRLDAFLPTVVESDRPARSDRTATRFRAACQRLGTPPEETLFVGDLYWSDARAASRVGLTGLLLDRNDWWARTGGPRIRSLGELPGWLDAPPALRAAHAESNEAPGEAK